MDNFSSGDSIIQHGKPRCCIEARVSDSLSQVVDSTFVPTTAVMPYNTLKREIDLLLHGHTIDDLTSSSCELDDMPPILFRKSSIQPQLAISKYTVEDMGFITKPIVRTPRPVNLIINGVSSPASAPDSEKAFDSEFYNAFQRCHQFIVNSKNVKISKCKSNFNQKKCSSRCARHYLFYLLWYMLLLVICFWFSYVYCRYLLFLSIPINTILLFVRHRNVILLIITKLESSYIFNV